MTLRTPAEESGEQVSETIMTRGAAQETTEQRTVSSRRAAGSAATAAPVAVTSSRTTVRDTVQGSRHTAALITQIIWYTVGLFEALLVLRLVIKFTAANTEAGFTQLILGVTRPLVFIFNGIFPVMTAGDLEFEPASVVAMVVYFLVGLGLARLVWIVYGEPREIV